MITLKIRNKKGLLKYTWNKRLMGIKGNNLTFDFGSVNDISGIPDHVFNFMFGIFMMDSLAYTGETLGLSELTEEEGFILDKILKLNHESNGCAGRAKNDKAPIIYSQHEPTAWPPTNDDEIICANGLGKDGLNVALLTKEMGYTPFCFTIYNQYWKRSKVGDDRLETIYSFYKEEEIDHTFIKTNFFKIRSSPIGFYPYAIGLPLAYLRNTNVILDGIQIHNNKTRISDGSFYCPGETHIVFDLVTRATGITVSSPLRAISNYGSQKLLAERWPQYLKYQRSCMFGLPWCGECPKCNRKALYLETLGIDPLSIKLQYHLPERLGLGSYGPVGDSVRQVLAKLEGQPYDAWIEGANENALDSIWNGDKLRDILSDHFHIYTEDPGPDGEGYTLEPSKWRDIKDVQFNL